MSEAHLSFPGGLASAQVEAVRRLHVAVGEARLRFIPNIPGQAETNAAKYRAAREYRPGANPSPWIASESARRGLSIAEAARALQDEENELDLKLSEIEQVRLQAENDIHTSSTPRQVFDIVDAVTVTLNAI